MKKTMLFIGSVIILILSAITFVFIPALSPNAAGKPLVFGKYGNKKIEYKQGTEFANAVANYTEMYKNQGAELNDTDYFYIYNYAFNSAVQAIAYSEAVEKSGYTPSKEVISRAMLPYFSDENGKFSTEIYNQIPEFDRENLKKELTKGLVWNRYSEDLLGSQNKIADKSMFGLKKSNSEIEFFAKMGATKRSFDVAVFDTNNYPDSEVKKFANENKNLFSKYNFLVLTVNEQSQAKSLLSQIKKNEITFEDAVKEYGEKYYSNAEGLISRGYEYQIKEIIKNDADKEAVLSLKVNELSDVVQTATGYSIFNCTAEKEEINLTEKNTVDLVRKYIEDYEFGKIEDYYLNVANKMIENAKTKNFAVACKENNAKLESISAFPLNYSNISMFDKIPTEKDFFASASSNVNLLKKAFSLKANEISEPIVIDNFVLVLKLISEQKDNINANKKELIEKEILAYDQSNSQANLLSSKKVVNETSKVFFNEILEKK